MAFKFHARRHFEMYDVSALPNFFTQKNHSRTSSLRPFCAGLKKRARFLTAGQRERRPWVREDDKRTSASQQQRQRIDMIKCKIVVLGNF